LAAVAAAEEEEEEEEKGEDDDEEEEEEEEGEDEEEEEVIGAGLRAGAGPVHASILCSLYLQKHTLQYIYIYSNNPYFIALRYCTVPGPGTDQPLPSLSTCYGQAVQNRAFQLFQKKHPLNTTDEDKS
jgi:hypothetical protein